MKRLVTILVGLSLAAPALAGDVYVTRDAEGKPVYTDRPQSLPADKVDVASRSSDPQEVEARYRSEMERYEAEQQAAEQSRAKAAETQRAAEMTAADRAQRCVAARQQYQTTLNHFRIYEELPNGERRYLTSEEIDAARADAKLARDEFCGQQ